MPESDQAIAVRGAQQELTNLKNELNKMIREMFILDYSDRLEDISLS